MKWYTKHRNNILMILGVLLLLIIVAAINLDNDGVSKRMLFVFSGICLILSGIVTILFARACNYYTESEKKNNPFNLKLRDGSNDEEKINDTHTDVKGELPEQDDIESAMDLELVDSVVNEIGSMTSLSAFTKKTVQSIAKAFDIEQIMLFCKHDDADYFKLEESYMITSEEKSDGFSLGEGLNGQVALDKEILYLENLSDEYLTVLSGAEKRHPEYLLITPIVNNDRAIGVLEISSSKKMNETIKNEIAMISNRIASELENVLQN